MIFREHTLGRQRRGNRDDKVFRKLPEKSACIRVAEARPNQQTRTSGPRQRCCDSCRIKIIVWTALETFRATCEVILLCKPQTSDRYIAFLEV